MVVFCLEVPSVKSGQHLYWLHKQYFISRRLNYYCYHYFFKDVDLAYSSVNCALQVQFTPSAYIFNKLCHITDGGYFRLFGFQELVL